MIQIAGLYLLSLNLHDLLDAWIRLVKIAIFAI